MQRRKEIPTNNLQEILDNAGMSQAALCRLTGIMPSTISSIIRGRVYPFPEYRRKISTALGLQSIDIFGIEAPEEVGKSIAYINNISTGIDHVYSLVPIDKDKTINKDHEDHDHLINNNKLILGDHHEESYILNNKANTWKGVKGETKIGTKHKEPKKDYTEDFEKFWDIYPRKIEKAASFEKWMATIRRGNKPDEIIAGAVDYARRCFRDRTEDKFIKHPKTFLGHNEHWREHLTPTAKEIKTDDPLDKPGIAAETFFDFGLEEINPSS